MVRGMVMDRKGEERERETERQRERESRRDSKESEVAATREIEYVCAPSKSMFRCSAISVAPFIVGALPHSFDKTPFCYITMV